MALKKPEQKKPGSLKERAAAMYKSIFGKDPEKAAEVQSLDVPLGDGRTLVSDAADAATLKGSNVTIDGNPAPDGDYPATDGTLLKVVGGKVADVVAAPAAKKDDKAMEERVAGLEAGVQTILQALEGLPAANKAAIESAIAGIETKLNGAFEQELTALKDSIGTEHTPARAAVVYSPKVDKNKSSHATISDHMARLSEKRAEQLKTRR